MKWRRKIASILTLCICLTVLMGCSRQAEVDTTGSKSVEKTEQKSREAKGRYVEAQIQFPDELKDFSMVSATRGKTGNLEFLMCDVEAKPYEYYFCSYDGTNWEQDTLGWMNQLTQKTGINVVHFLYGKDGNYYMGGHDKDYIYHLYKILEGGEVQELLHDLFQVPEGEKYGLRADMLDVSENGKILVSTAKNAYYCTQEGEQLYVMPQDVISVEYRFCSFLEDEQYITVFNNHLVRYDLKNGARCENVGDLEGNMNESLIFQGDSQDIYHVNKSGLYHMVENGTVWEQLIDGSLNSMGMQNQYIRHFFRGDNQDFYGVSSEVGYGKPVFYHYTYNPDMVAVPPNALNIYALYDSPSVRQAASLFQKNNPDVKVDFRVALDGQTALVTEDIIRSLNTELLNGKGADVLILDGLPAQAYKEKGILMDMSSFLTELSQETPLLPNIIDDFKEEDGSIYCIPMRITIPIAFGEKEGIKALESLEGIKNYNKEIPLFAVDLYENMLRMVANLNYTELFAKDSKKVEENALIKYLSAVKSVGEKNHAKTEFTDEDMEIYWVNNLVNPSGFIRTDECSYDRKESAVGIVHVSSVFDLMLPWAVMNKEGLHPSSVNQIYFPSVMVSINQSSVHKELAQEFVKTLCSNEIQEVEYDLNDGFPVNQSALEAWKVMQKETAIGVSFGNEDYTLEAGWPSTEEISEVLNIIPTLTTPVNVDQVLMGMIVDGSKEYFNGNATVEEAAAEIESKLRIYLAE